MNGAAAAQPPGSRCLRSLQLAVRKRIRPDRSPAADLQLLVCGVWSPATDLQLLISCLLVAAQLLPRPLPPAPPGA